MVVTQQNYNAHSRTQTANVYLKDNYNLRERNKRQKQAIEMLNKYEVNCCNCV